MLKQLDLENPPAGTIKFTDCKSKRITYYVPTGKVHPKYGIKYRPHDGAKFGRPSYLVSNITDYGSVEYL